MSEAKKRTEPAEDPDSDVDKHDKKGKMGKASVTLARVFKTAPTAMCSMNATQLLITTVEVPQRLRKKYPTIPLMVAHLKDTGYDLKISNHEDISQLVATTEVEFNADIDLTVSVLLFLVGRSPNRLLKEDINEFIITYAEADDRKAFMDDFRVSQKCPASEASVVKPEKLNFSGNDWENLFEALFVLVQQKSHAQLLREQEAGWEQVRQGSNSIKLYLCEERALWSALISTCTLLEVSAPSDRARTRNLLGNLNKPTKSMVARHFRDKLQSTEFLSYTEIVEDLREIEERSTLSYDWENPRDLPRESTLKTAIPQGKRNDCPHCKRTAVIHSPEECSSNPKNQRPFFPRHGAPKVNSEFPKPVTKENIIPIAKKDQEKHDQLADSKPHGYNLRSVKQAKNLALAAVDGFPFVAKAYYNEKELIVAFDTLSCETLIRRGLINQELLVSLPEKVVRGIGGSAALGNKGANVTLSLDGTDVSISGRITDIPAGIDVIIGNPCLSRLRARISYRNDTPQITIMDEERAITLHSLRSLCMAAIEDSLPSLTLATREELERIPYQCRHDYAVPHHLVAKIEEELASEIAAGHMAQCAYDARMWISPLFVKEKPNGSIRLLADLRNLNSCLKHPSYWSQMSSNLQTFPDFISASPDMHFCTIDIKNAFHSCAVDENSQHLLVVRVLGKLYKYKCCPQGLSSSALFWPLHLQAGLNHLLGEEWHQYACVFVDDILIFGSTKISCAENTAQILDALKLLNKTVSEKSILEPQTKVNCLGLEFSCHGVRINDSGVETLLKALAFPPKSAKCMRRLIGSIQYASSLLDHPNPTNFAAILKPLHESLKLKKWKMSADIEDSIAKIKNLVNPTTRGYMHPQSLQGNDSILVICTDASDKAIGGTLSVCKCTEDQLRRDPPAAISNGILLDTFSHGLSDTESRWHTYELEAYAVFTAASRWKGLLVASCMKGTPESKVFFFTDSQTTLSRWRDFEKVAGTAAKAKRFAGWACETSYLSAIHAKFLYLAGELNQLADVLSRLSEQMFQKISESDEIIWVTLETCPDFVHVTLTEEIIVEMLDAYERDTAPSFHKLSLKEIYNYLLDPTSAHEALRGKLASAVQDRFMLCGHPICPDKKLLYTRRSFQNNCNDFVLVVPDMPKSSPRFSTILPLFEDGLSARQEILVWAHETKGHQGTGRASAFIRSLFWWPRVQNDIETHISKCSFCSSKREYKYACGYQIVGSNRFELIQMDHKILPDEVAQRINAKAVLTIIDTVTGWTTFTPVRSLKAIEVAFTVVTKWIRYFGIPKTIQTDNSTSFSGNSIIKETCTLLGCRLKLIQPYSPTSNGRVERSHRELAKWLSSHAGLITDDQSLEYIVSLAEMQINQSDQVYPIVFGCRARNLAEALTLHNEENDAGTAHRGFGNLPPEGDFVRRLTDTIHNNTEWKNFQLEATGRENIFYRNQTARDRRLPTLEIAVGGQVLYEGVIWDVRSISYGTNPTTPTGVVLSDPDDPQKTRRAKYTDLRPAPETLGVSTNPLIMRSPPVGAIIFYKYGGPVFCGAVITTTPDAAIVHLHTPNAKQTIYYPNWWIMNGDDWSIVRQKDEPHERHNPKAVVHSVPLEDIVATGKLENYKMTGQISRQLFQRGVFTRRQTHPAAVPEGAM